MYASTRFPEAIPLRNMKSKAIIKTLIKCFTQFGLPKSVQTDQGLNFMSGIFQKVMNELGIQQFKLKMKLWFEKATRERTLQSDIGVVLLLFILLTFLQIRYGRPYKVKKKMN